MSSSSSSSRAQRGEANQVFLNFRGDLREFANKLRDKLEQIGIRAFVDDESIRPGTEIGEAILSAIQSARISIPIFSKRYTRSHWCLKELTEMVKCMGSNRPRQVILPIFYDVEPKDVKRIIWENVGSGLQKFPNVDKKIVEEWKASLRTVGGLKGWEKSKFRNDDELINKVVLEVSKRLALRME